MIAKMKEYQFQAETKQLLDLMIHSLYTNKEIFLRELISNSSDALDRLRFEALTNPALLDGDNRYEIRLESDKDKRTLSISDTGIGMSQEEVVANIGTMRYLRFIKGVVDSADLPLNISRQMLQQDRHITQIRKWLTKKVLDTLQELKEKEYDKYLQFWEQFGRALKEGVSSDYDNKDRIVSLLLFQSSNEPEKLTTLKGYVERMKEGQNEIYYLTGGSRGVVENLTHITSGK